MGSGINYIPRKDRDFKDFAEHFTAAVAKIAARVEVPEERVSELEKLCQEYRRLYEICINENIVTRIARLQKNSVRSVLERLIRSTVNEYLNYNHRMDPIERDALGLPMRKTTRTPAPVAETPPKFVVDTSMYCRIIIYFSDKKRAKAMGQYGAELFYAVLPEPTNKVDDLTHEMFRTRSPFILDFPESERGRTLYFVMRWRNTRSVGGPWTLISKAIIP
jgi:hypothetical protein